MLALMVVLVIAQYTAPFERVIWQKGDEVSPVGT